MGLTSDFAISLNGHCFVRLASPLTQQAVDNDNISSKLISANSLQCLSRFLKVDRRKVFRGKNAIPTHLVEKVEKARLMVDLCEDCANLNHKFFQLFSQLEKIKMQVTSHLRKFQERLLQSGEVNWSAVNPVDSNDKLSAKLEIAEVIRKDLTKKCSRKLKMLPPRIRLQKVTAEKIHKRWRCRPIQLNSSAFSSSVLPVSNIKLENEHDNGNEMAEEIGNDSFDELPEHGNTTKILGSFKVDEFPVTPTTTRNPNHSRYVRTKSGKFKCLVCHNVLGSRKTAHFHYKTIHSTVRFKCSKCTKTFVQKGNLNTHFQSVHLRRRYSCEFCFQTFSSPSTRSHHLRKTNCSRKKSYKGPRSERWSSRQPNQNHSEDQDPLEVTPANDSLVLPRRNMEVPRMKMELEGTSRAD